jgi:hypothetical protein
VQAERDGDAGAAEQELLLVGGHERARFAAVHNID